MSDYSVFNYFSGKIALISLGLFAGGGLAAYAILRYRSQGMPQNAKLIQQLNEVQEEIKTLKKSLDDAVSDVRRELDGIRGAVLRTKAASRTSLTTWSDDDDFQSVEEFPVGEVKECNNTSSFLERIDCLNDGDDQDKEEAMRLLQDQEITQSESFEILWRLSRAHVTFYDMKIGHDVRQLHATSALDYARRAVKLNDNSAEAHKWVAISLGITTDFVGTKEKIESGYQLKEHIDRAIELDSTQAVLHYMKGRWCWGVCMLTWIERKLAATLFATPPSSTVEDAMYSFHEAEEKEPGFYKANRVYLSKCYYYNKDYVQAKQWALAAVELPSNTQEDRDMHKEAEDILKKL